MPHLPLLHASADAEQALKSLAKQLARDSAADIEDRHLRARLRTRYYNQLLSLLRHFDSQRTADRQRQRRWLTAAAGTIALLGAALTGTMLFF
jgi:hypothetical protein